VAGAGDRVRPERETLGGVVVPWDLEDAQTRKERPRLRRQIRETLRRRYASQRIALRLDASDPCSINEFGRALSVVVQESAMQYLRQGAPRADVTKGTAAWPNPAGGIVPSRREESDGL